MHVAEWVWQEEDEKEYESFIAWLEKDDAIAYIKVLHTWLNTAISRRGRCKITTTIHLDPFN